MPIQNAIHKLLYSVFLVGMVTACSSSDTENKQATSINMTESPQQTTSALEENTHKIPNQTETIGRSISVTLSDGTTQVISEDGLSLPVKSFDGSHMAYLSKDDTGKKPKLNLYDMEKRKNNVIEIQAFVEQPYIKSIGWYDHNTLFFSTAAENDPLGKVLYALYTDDMTIKKLRSASILRLKIWKMG